jgi:hypothetical protein
MDSTVSAALVAGAVSVVGVAINLWIARQTRRAAEAQARLTAQLQQDSEIRRDFRNLEREGEMLRIRLQRLLPLLERHSVDTRQAPLDRGAFKEVLQQADLFADSWAPVKMEIPVEVEGFLRELRHECIDVIRTGLVAMMIPREWSARDTRTALFSIKTLLPSLDLFIKCASTIRRGGIHAVLTLPEVVEQLRNWRDARKFGTPTDPN